MEGGDFGNTTVDVTQPHDELDYEDDLPPECQHVLQQLDNVATEEFKDDEMEEGEVEDEPINSVTPRKPCFFYKIGKCTWGRQCKFLHPSINDTGAYQLIPDPNDPLHLSIDLTEDQSIQNTAISDTIADDTQWVPESVFPRTAAESAWEEGLRQARQMRERAEHRRREDKDFADKRLNLRVKDTDNTPEEPDDELTILQNAQTKTKKSHIDDKFTNHSSMSTRPNIHSDLVSSHCELRHNSFYDFKHRHSRAYPRKYAASPHRNYFRSDSHRSKNVHSVDNEWHDPWSRRQSNKHKRIPTSESSSSISRSSSSSRSISSDSSGSSSKSSCSSGSSSRRYRPRRRSPSVKRSRPSSPAVLRSVVVASLPVSNEPHQGSIDDSPPNESQEVQRFRPGRQISSHTLKKAQREGKLEEALEFSSDGGSSKISSRESSPLSFSSTESSSDRSSDIVPSTIGAQAAATRLENDRLRQNQNSNSDNEDKVFDNEDVTILDDKDINDDELKTSQRQRTNEQKAALLKQLQEIEEEIARKRRGKK